MIDHVAIEVSDFEASKAFYLKALAPLGYELVMESEGPTAGFGAAGKPDFWINAGKPQSPVHIAFGCAERPPVDAFYAAAMEAGATGNGVPALRPQYHEHYYAAFVLDPDQNNIEAVCHVPH